MKLIACPHCGHERAFKAKVPKELVLVMPCPACGELLALYRGKAIALDRKVIENGTFEELTAHLAHVIADFLRLGKFGALRESGSNDDDLAAGDADEDAMQPFHTPEQGPITHEEVRHFIEVDLQRLDEGAYFKRHFG